MTGKGRRLIAALVLGGLLLAAGGGLWAIRPVLAPFFLAVVVAYLIAPLVNSLTRWGFGRGWAILTVYGVLTLLVSLAVGKGLPAAIAEIRRLTESIPLYSAQARALGDGFQAQIRTMGLPPELRDMLDDAIINTEVRSMQVLERLLDVNNIVAMAGFLASLALAPFLAFYLLKDIDRFKERFVLSIPARYRQEILSLLRALDRVLAGFVRGQVLLAVVVGAMVAVATSLLGLRYALLLGIWAGMTEFIPYVGPVLGAIPSVIAGFTVSPVVALQTVVVFVIIQQVENAVLSPKILGESVGLHPLAVLLSVLAGGYLFGGWGMIFALPIVGVARVLLTFGIGRLTEVPLLAAPAARPESGDWRAEEPKR